MLQKIHDKVSGWFAGFLLAALAIVFTFWGINFGFDTASYAAKVKAEGMPWWRPAVKIGTGEVRRAWQNQIARFQQMYRGQLPEQLQASLKEQLLEEFVRSEVLTQHTTRLGYRVSDKQVLKSIEETPAFQIEGKYSKDTALFKLQQAGLSASAFEEQRRKDLQLAQLQEAISQSAFVTPAELASNRRLAAEQREASWLVIPAAKFVDGIKPDDAAIKAYYDGHQSEFMTAETVVLRFVELRVADVAAAVKVTEQDLRTHYENAKDRYVDEKTRQPKTFEAAQAQVESDFRTEEAEKRFGDLQEKLADKAFENLNELDTVAKDLNLTVQEIPAFRRDTGGGILGARPQIIEAAFSEPVLNGENSRPIELSPGHVVVLRVSAHRAAEPKPIADVRDAIVAAVKKEKSEQQARELAERSAALAQAGSEDLRRLAAEFKTQPQGPKFISRTDTEMPAEARNVLFATPHPQAGKALFRPVALGNGDAAILKFSAVRQDTAEETAEQRTARETQLRERLAQGELGAYIADVRRSARVTVNPKVFD